MNPEFHSHEAHGLNPHQIADSILAPCLRPSQTLFCVQSNVHEPFYAWRICHPDARRVLSTVVWAFVARAEMTPLIRRISQLLRHPELIPTSDPFLALDFPEHPDEPAPTGILLLRHPTARSLLAQLAADVMQVAGIDRQPPPSHN